MTKPAGLITSVAIMVTVTCGATQITEATGIIVAKVVISWFAMFNYY